MKTIKHKKQSIKKFFKKQHQYDYMSLKHGAKDMLSHHVFDRHIFPVRVDKDVEKYFNKLEPAIFPKRQSSNLTFGEKSTRYRKKAFKEHYKDFVAHGFSTHHLHIPTNSVVTVDINRDISDTQFVSVKISCVSESKNRQFQSLVKESFNFVKVVVNKELFLSNPELQELCVSYTEKILNHYKYFSFLDFYFPSVKDKNSYYFYNATISSTLDEIGSMFFTFKQEIEDAIKNNTDIPNYCFDLTDNADSVEKEQYFKRLFNGYVEKDDKYRFGIGLHICLPVSYEILNDKNLLQKHFLNYNDVKKFIDDFVEDGEDPEKTFSKMVKPFEQIDNPHDFLKSLYLRYNENDELLIANQELLKTIYKVNKHSNLIRDTSLEHIINLFIINMIDNPKTRSRALLQNMSLCSLSYHKNNKLKIKKIDFHSIFNNRNLMEQIWNSEYSLVKKIRNRTDQTFYFSLNLSSVDFFNTVKNNSMGNINTYYSLLMILAYHAYRYNCSELIGFLDEWLNHQYIEDIANQNYELIDSMVEDLKSEIPKRALLFLFVKPLRFDINEYGGINGNEMDKVKQILKNWIKYYSE